MFYSLLNYCLYCLIYNFENKSIFLKFIALITDGSWIGFIVYMAVDESQSKSQLDYNKQIIHFFSFMHTDIIRSFVIRVNMHIRVILIKNMNSGMLQVVYYPVEGMLSTWNVEAVDKICTLFSSVYSNQLPSDNSGFHNHSWGQLGICETLSQKRGLEMTTNRKLGHELWVLVT